MTLSSLLLAFQPPPEFNFEPNAGGGAAGGIMGLLCSCGMFIPILAILIATIVGMWRIFEKAGKPGWASIVPIYNTYILTEIAGMDIMWFILTLVPCVNIVAFVMIWINVCKNFGKDTGYAIGMLLLPMIFVPMLGFSDARYTPMKH